tara:strand:+ start:2299 stop:2478 length:180 start_codon:yes stop_codon:yes gene_type:complete
MREKMTFRKIVENALHKSYDPDMDLANRGMHLPQMARHQKIYDWYEKRYLNPDSPERIK